MRFYFQLALLMAMLNQAYAITYEQEQIKARISPLGRVNVQGENPAAKSAKTDLAEAPIPAAKKEPGEETYNKYCITCHQTGLAGAPKFRAADWVSRLKQKKISGLTASAVKGINAMPPKGTCAECTEADIQAAIEYMVPRQ